MVKWTKEQERAIYEKDKDILVAAAAGSGKTAVLVERIIQKVIDKENPIDIDSLLVATFTNAAAEEMRNRVAVALEAALDQDPSSIHLKKQLSLLQRASISTLHSFCMNIVREYAYLIDIDPAFRIATTMEIDLLKQDTLDELFEDWYGKADDERALFLDFIDRFSNDRNDQDVEELVLQLFTFAMQNPWPEKWLDELLKMYEIPENWTEKDLPWLDLMKAEVQFELTAIKEILTKTIALVNDPDGPHHYLEAIESDQKLIEMIQTNSSSWQQLEQVMEKLSFKRLSGKKYECDEEKKELVKAYREDYKKRLETMKKNWFIRDLTSHVLDLQKLRPIFEQLIEFIKEFKLLFEGQKRERAMVDFSDLEHFCLAILVEQESEEIRPSFVAKRLQEKYTELLVDEYQDTNLVQETIIQLIRKEKEGQGNLFMVGDVKQSIYRFRHAEPSLFLEKYKRFYTKPNTGMRIDLARNFRSREEVLIGTNYLFRQIMDEELGEIIYDQDAELIYANKMYDEFPLINSEVELFVVDNAKDAGPLEDEASEQLDKAQLEARQYVKIIKDLIGDQEKKPFMVIDKTTGNQRPIRFNDIVILHRSLTWAGIIIEEFKKQNIPVHAELSTGYFEAIEIKIMISLLKVIDNPRQDIPLAAVLRSPIVGLDEEELTQIRLEAQGVDFYEALLAFQKSLEESHPIKRFLSLLKKFRLAAKQGALADLIWEIYRETGYYDFVGGMPGGRQRQANLRALYDRARAYETTSFRGLFRFLRLIERMEERKEDLGAAPALSEKEDVVRIMTIHSSKGLEFPIVILGGTGREFNKKDLSGKYLIDKDYGFASQYIDPVKRITYPTLYYHAIKNIKRRQALAEEMRVLYVALTRAKEKLFMVGTVNHFEKTLDKWQQTINEKSFVLPSYVRIKANTYLDWVGPALMRHQDSDNIRSESLIDPPKGLVNDPSKWNITIVPANDLVEINSSEPAIYAELENSIKEWKTLEIKGESKADFVNDRLTYRYAHEQAARVRAKQTVTELKRQSEQRDEYSADELIPRRRPIVKRPLFMQAEKSLTAAERGTAMHTVMQHLPLNHPWTKESLRNYLTLLVEREIIREDVIAEIDLTAIITFFKSPIAAKMQSAPNVYREIPFSLSLPASEVLRQWESAEAESVLIQGVIDCLIPVDDGFIMLDYKTDAIFEEINDHLREKLRKRYETQLTLYKRAVEEIWQKPVIATYLYFFAKSLLLPFEEK